MALVVAVAGGLSMTSLAAARRTASSFTRFLEASEVSDLSIAVAPVAEDQTSLDGAEICVDLALLDGAS